MQRSLAVVNLENVKKNALIVKERAGNAKICAVVKCDAYGHGAIAISHALENDIDCFAVAIIDEGVQLKISGVSKDVLVLQPALCEIEVLRAVNFDLILTIASIEDFTLIKTVCDKFNVTVRAHLKCNTGMNRLGFDYWQFSNACLNIKSEKRIIIEGIYSHFYLPENKMESSAQFNLFIRFCLFAERVFGKIIKHISATGGLFSNKDYSLDMVRVGIALYGYFPRGIKSENKLYPAMQVYARAVQNRKYETGGIAYGKTNFKYSDITTLRLGYGEGFFRSGKIGNINNLCMDSFVIGKKYQRGELVPVMLDADVYAKKHNTISYEVLCSVSKRAEIIYTQ